PPEQQMNREIARHHAATAKRYGRSARHTIQVDFLAYMKEIRRERRMGARRGTPGVKRTTAAESHVRPRHDASRHSEVSWPKRIASSWMASAPVSAWVSGDTWLP